MRIVHPTVDELYNKNPQKHIEAIGRICYKSEYNITEDSDEKFISNLISRSHNAMLEHFRFIVIVPKNIYESILEINSPYIVTTNHIMPIISASARGFMEALILDGLSSKSTVAIHTVIRHIIWYYGCRTLFNHNMPLQQYNMGIVDMNNIMYNDLSDFEKFKHGWHSIFFMCDRGITHELVRHRIASFAQESTRFCNYSNDKFNKEITVINPLFFDKNSDNPNIRRKYRIWEDTCKYSEVNYFKLLENGASPQEARSVLPNSLKTEIVVTCTNEEWKHILNLRYTGITGSPHPQMYEIMDLLIKDYNWAKRLLGDKL